MAWMKADAANGRGRDDLIVENGGVKSSRSLIDASPADTSPVKKKLDGKDSLSYANILRSRNKFLDAIVLYENILEKDSNNVDAILGKGICLQMQNLTRQAFECFSEAIRLDPQNACALTYCGILYKDEGHLLEAAEAKHMHCDIGRVELQLPWLLLSGVLYRDAGNIPLAIEAYERCLKIDPDSRNAGQNRLLAMNYINEGKDDLLFEAHRDWGKRFFKLFTQYTTWDNSKERDRPLVIGYISPDFFTHSVSYFIEAPLSYHNYTNYKVVVYSAVVKADAKTFRFRDRVLKRGGIWRDIYGVDEKKVAGIIREDRVDILVELTGHTANNRLGTMACRPAPVQATWIGYPNTTGLPTIDYRFSDSMVDPPNTKQNHVEELIRLPECFLCYTPSSEAGPVSPTPALSNGFVTFGSFNNLAKKGEWNHHSSVDSIPVFVRPYYGRNNDYNGNPIPSYMGITIPSLDTFPYAGTTTTCESLYMGVPCVTMAGSVHAHNVGVSLLTKVGLGHLVAKTEEEYVQLALELSSDVKALSDLRMSLRVLMLKSPVCDGQRFTEGLESAYRNLWHRYCRGDIPSLKNMELSEHLLQSSVSGNSPAKSPSTNASPNQVTHPKMNGITPISSSITSNSLHIANGGDNRSGHDRE